MGAPGLRHPGAVDQDLTRARPDRPDRAALLSPEQAAELMGLLEILASDSRLRLHALARAGELCVSDLAATHSTTTSRARG
jgi:hypothetical protein